VEANDFEGQVAAGDTAADSLRNRGCLARSHPGLVVVKIKVDQIPSS